MMILLRNSPTASPLFFSSACYFTACSYASSLSYNYSIFCCSSAYNCPWLLFSWFHFLVISYNFLLASLAAAAA
jgi:hypothetical protein